MSLVGSLEDLGLGDILQIIHLSRKSGVLTLRSGHGEGHVLFDGGLICGAYLKNGPSELRELVAAAQLVPADELEAAFADARARGVRLARVLLDRCLVAADALDRLLHEHVEAAVIEMFRWGSGEFSFEVRKLEPESEELFLERGLNPQFLALEGTRQLDECDRSGEDLVFAGEDQVEGAFEGTDFGVDPDRAALTDAVREAEAEVREEDAVVEALPDDGEASEAEVEAVWVADEASTEAAASALPEADDLNEAQGSQSVEAPAPPLEAPATVDRPPPPIVAIDSQLPVLEWIKATLGDRYPRVHIFQTSDLGISRIRQYLARRELPVVLIAADAPADPVSGARDSAEIVGRLRAQAARMPVLILGEQGGAAEAEGAVPKPSATDLADARQVASREACAEALVEGVARAWNGTAAPSARPPAHSDARVSAERDAVGRLREVSEKLRDPSNPSEVLPLVLGFAAQTFSRVAMFLVIEGRAVGMSGRGLDRAGGPADGALEGLTFSVADVPWFQSVVTKRAPIRGVAAAEADQSVTDALGGVPDQAYLAPIESGGEVVAILYGDELPGDGALPDTQALEVVLHQGGLALDRVVLERALEQSEP